MSEADSGLGLLTPRQVGEQNLALDMTLLGLMEAKLSGDSEGLLGWFWK